MMSDLREAAQQALEAMDRATRFMSRSDYRKLNEAIAALRAALARYQEEKDAEYERAFLDGVRKQTESTVDRAVNRMARLAQERVTTVSPITPGVVGVMPITVPRVLTDADLDAIREIVREGGKK